MSYDNVFYEEGSFFDKVIMIIALVACAFIIIEVTKMNHKCPMQTVVTNNVVQENEDLPITSKFKTMFEQSSPWMGIFTDSSNLQKRDDNNYREMRE